MSMSNVRPARKDGYVNWNDTHEYLKTMKWKPMDEFTRKCGDIERGKRWMHKTFSIEPLLTSAEMFLDENTRFPENQLYLNISHPAVLTELLYINEQKRPKAGLLQHFIDITKDQVHTRTSFEKKYGLRWVDPSEVPEVMSEPYQECGFLTTIMQVPEEINGPMQEQRPLTMVQVPEVPTQPMQEKRPLTTVQVPEVPTEPMQEQRSLTTVQVPEAPTEPMQEQRPLTTMQVPEVPAEPMQDQRPLTNEQVSEVKTETTQEHRSPLSANDSPSNPVRSDPQHIPGVMDQEVADSDSNPIIATNENQDQNNLKTRELVQKLSQIKDKLNMNEFNNLLQELKTLMKWLYDEPLKEIVQKVIDNFYDISLDLTENKFMVLYEELLSFEISDEIQAEIFVDTLFLWTQTIEEPILTRYFARVYNHMFLNKNSSDGYISLKKIFRNKWQSQFEKICNNCPMMMDEKIIKTNKVKAIATIRLISELYIIGDMVTTEMFENIISGLSARLEEEELLECLYELIQITGEMLQFEKSKELPIALRRMVQYIDHKKISNNVLTMIENARVDHFSH